jgi:hypothetical protein
MEKFLLKEIGCLVKTKSSYNNNSDPRWLDLLILLKMKRGNNINFTQILSESEGQRRTLDSYYRHENTNTKTRKNLLKRKKRPKRPIFLMIINIFQQILANEVQQFLKV